MAAAAEVAAAAPSHAPPPALEHEGNDTSWLAPLDGAERKGVEAELCQKCAPKKSRNVPEWYAQVMRMNPEIEFVPSGKYQEDAFGRIFQLANMKCNCCGTEQPEGSGWWQINTVGGIVPSGKNTGSLSKQGHCSGKGRNRNNHTLTLI
jgi:hypothetical protein